MLFFTCICISTVTGNLNDPARQAGKRNIDGDRQRRLLLDLMGCKVGVIHHLISSSLKQKGKDNICLSFFVQGRKEILESCKKLKFKVQGFKKKARKGCSVALRPLLEGF